MHQYDSANDYIYCRPIKGLTLDSFQTNEKGTQEGSLELIKVDLEIGAIYTKKLKKKTVIQQITFSQST